MATSAISSSDLSNIRNKPHQLTAVRMNCVRPSVVATYSISGGTQAVITNLSGTLSDGVIGDVLVGRRVQLTDGTYKQWSTVRKTCDASNLYINALGEGQGGYVTEIAPAQSSLTTAYIYNDFPLYGEYSRVVSKSSPILPRWDLAFSNQTSSAIPPIANAGTHQSASVAVGASATFTLPRAGSNTSFAFNSETISTYAWSLPTGVTIGAGYTTADDVIEVTATAGQHLITLTVTDSNSQTHTAYVWLFVDDNSTYKTLNDEFQSRIVSDNRTRKGRTLEVELMGQASEDVFLQGSLFHIQTEQTYGGSSLTDGVIVDTIVGYIQNISPSYDGNVYRTRLTVVSPVIYLQNVASPSQVIFEKSSPANWTQVTSALSNPRGALSYLRWQCQNLFALHDIDCSYTEPRKKSYQFSGSTIGSHLEVIAQAIAGNVGSASDGTLVVRKNPVIEDNTFRNALAVGCTFGASDIVGQIEYNEPVHVLFQDVRSGAFAYNGSKTNAWYGVKRWAQGSGKTELPTFTVTTSDGRDAVLEKVGHMSADLNSPTTQAIQLSRDFDVVDPVYMIWYRLNASSTYDARGTGWTNERILPESVSVAWDLQNYTKTPTLTFKKETFGQPAEEYFIGSGNTAISNGWLVSNSLQFTPTLDTFGLLPNIAILLNTSGQLAITQNLLDASPVYFDLSSYVTGTVCDVCYDYNSNFFTSGYIATEPLSIYIVSASSTTLYIYRLDDIKSPVATITELETYTMNDSGTTTTARIRCSRTTPTFVVMAFHDQTGVRVGRSTNGGSTWGSLVRVGTEIVDTGNDNAEIGLYVEGTNQIVTAPDSYLEYAPYKATTTGGSFSELANANRNTAPNYMITGDLDTTLYVSSDNNSTFAADYSIDFDGGYSTYSLGGVNNSNANDTHTGNPGNAGGADIPTTTGVQLITLVLDITSLPTINMTRFEMDWYFDGEFSTTSSPNVTANIVWTTTPASSSHTVYTDTKNTGSGSTSFEFSGENTWTSFGEDDSISSVTAVHITFSISDNTAMSDLNVDTQGEVMFDNIRIYTSSGALVAPTFYKITAYKTSPSWNDRTPAANYIPELPYGLAIDYTDSDNLELFATNGTTPKWYDSTNTATSWTDKSASDYRTGIKTGDVMYLAGSDKFDITDDDGTTLIDKRGNLGVVWGSVGTIKQIMVVTE